MIAAPGAAPAAARALARAKVNLFLHVVGRRHDGYHLLDSLVVFPAVGDLLEAEPAAGLSLTLDGPFGAELAADADNLVLRAAGALRDHLGADVGAALRLVKELPVASGIGGGSADAAATLSALSRLWRARLGPEALDAVALSLGADVPVCLRSPAPAFMRGIGEDVTPAPALPDFWLVLVNPGVVTPTPAVFKALERKDNPPPPAAPSRFASLSDLTGWLAATRNDLEPPALALFSEIAAPLAALGAQSGCALARMSGSGATCFGLFATQAEALEAARAIRTDAPRWWVVAAPVTADAPAAAEQTRAN